MKNKICIGSGIVLLITAAYTQHNIPLNIIGTGLLVTGTWKMYGLSSGVEYSTSHYRIYTRYLFWKRGKWKSISGVRRIYIREYSYLNEHALNTGTSSPDASERVVEYQLYFVRKSGYYKIFSSDSLGQTRMKASALASQYNLTVEESKKLVQAKAVKFPQKTAVEA